MYFGDGAYGAEAAAERSFGKSAKDLDPSKAVTLAGLLYAPPTYTTWDGEVLVQRTRDRRDGVPELMQEQGMISSEERQKAKAEPLKFVSDPPPEGPVHAPLLEKVRREVDEELGPRAPRHGGLRIHTRMDPDLRHAAVETAGDALPVRMTLPPS